MRSSRKEVDKLESPPASGGISPVKRWNFTDCQVDRGEGGGTTFHLKAYYH